MATGDSTRQITQVVYRIPRWAQVLGGSAVLGVSFASDPVGWVRAVVMQWVVGGLLDLAGQAGVLLGDVWRITADVFVLAGVETVRPFSIVGDKLIVLIELVAGVVTDVAAMAGPLGPLVVVVAWAAVAVALAYLARLVLEAVKWIT